MYSIAPKRVHEYTCIQYENRKVASSAPKECVSISRLFHVSVFEFQLFLLAIIWIVLQPMATNDL